MTTDTDAQVREQQFVAQDTWPDVSAMISGFGDPSLPASDKLAGTELDIRYDDGATVRYHFDTDSSVTLMLGEDAPSTQHELSGTYPYRAVEARPQVFLVDILTGEGANSRSITFVVDLEDGRVTTATSRVVVADGKGHTETDFRSGRITGHGDIEPRKHSNELVGKRIYYRYSETERYEHIYLNAGTFVWHCISGAEAGLADVDETRTFELADGIVIFHWKEGVMPVESFLVVDLHNQRSIGRMFCWENSTQSVVHIPFDSRFTILNTTTYPND